MKMPLSNILLAIAFITATSAVSAQYTSPQAQNQQQQQEVKFPEKNAFSNSKLTARIINSPNNTFGYDILADGKMVIHQPSKPGMPGNEGFKTKIDAQKVSQLIIGKIKKGEMPPSVTPEELKKALGKQTL